MKFYFVQVIFHNEFLNEILSFIKQNNLVHLLKYLSEVLCIHPIAVNEHSCIVGEQSRYRRSNYNVPSLSFFNNDSLYRDLIQLVRSHFDEGQYDFGIIEEDIVASYVAGKSKIDDCSSKLRKIFHFKLPDAKEHGDPTE